MLPDMDPLLLPILIFIIPCYLNSLIMFFIVRNRTSGIVRFEKCSIVFLTGVVFTSCVGIATFAIAFNMISIGLVNFVCTGTLLISTPQLLVLLGQFMELRRAKISDEYL